MSRVIIICALAAILGDTAKADEVLTFRIVGHGTSVQSQEVGDITCTSACTLVRSCFVSRWIGRHRVLDGTSGLHQEYWSGFGIR